MTKPEPSASRCPDCGPCRIDEDGCCVTCGADTEYIHPGSGKLINASPVFPPTDVGARRVFEGTVPTFERRREYRECACYECFMCCRPCTANCPHVRPEPASPPTDVDRRLDEVRARAEPYKPTDEEEPTCARCRAEVETEGEDWSDGDLCLECEAVERNEAVEDRRFLLALVDELRRR